MVSDPKNSKTGQEIHNRSVAQGETVSLASPGYNNSELVTLVWVDGWLMLM